MRKTWITGVTVLVLLLISHSGVATLRRPMLGDRSFEFVYTVRVTEIPPGTRRAEVWLPLPREEGQKILRLAVKTPGRAEVHGIPTSGDTVLYVAVNDPPREFAVRQRVTLTRYEARQPTDLLRNPATVEEIDPRLFDGYLRPNPSEELNTEIRKIATRETSEKTTVVEKVRALYDWVAEKMTYDKSGKGWGLGDVRYCLRVGKGNCTDFHSLFIALCRAAGIPARWNIGFPIAYSHNGGKRENVGGYHCWAEFYVPGNGWVPVDISEGDRNPELKDYFFGNLSGNRILYTRGRNLKLVPPAPTPPLNYFIYPVIAIDGKEHRRVVFKFSYRDLN